MKPWLGSIAGSLDLRMSAEGFCCSAASSSGAGSDERKGVLSREMRPVFSQRPIRTLNNLMRPYTGLPSRSSTSCSRPIPEAQQEAQQWTNSTSS